MAFRIITSKEALGHLHHLTAAQSALVTDTIEEQLTHQPTVETRNRKRMEENELATWELRIRDLRVYYDVEEEHDQVVWIRAIGIKVRSQVFIDGKEARL